MSKRRSDWYIPGDWLVFFGMLVIIPSVAMMGSMLLPAFSSLKIADISTLYRLGVGAGILGAFLLFIARLPLYRARLFWTFGPHLLDRTHRWYYWLAYVAVGSSLLLLLVVWLRAS